MLPLQFLNPANPKFKSHLVHLPSNALLLTNQFDQMLEKFEILMKFSIKDFLIRERKVIQFSFKLQKSKLKPLHHLQMLVKLCQKKK
jgi:hypothetical protein